MRSSKVTELWNEFDTVQSQIEECDQGDTQSQERIAFEESYYRTLAEIRKRIDFKADVIATRNRLPPQVESTETEGISQQDKVKLPRPDLPKFNGTYSQWLLFRDTFHALIESNTTLGNIQKFYYLKSCLHGNAAQILQSLEISADNYMMGMGSAEGAI